MGSLLRNRKAEKAKPTDVEQIDFPKPDEEIIIKETTGRKKRRIKGTVDKVYDTFISVDLKGKAIKESFLKVDFLTGNLKLM